MKEPFIRVNIYIGWRQFPWSYHWTHRNGHVDYYTIRLGSSVWPVPSHAHMLHTFAISRHLKIPWFQLLQACERYEEFPPGHVFDSKSASLALCRRGWDLGLRVSPVAANFFRCFLDFLVAWNLLERKNHHWDVFFGPTARTSDPGPVLWLNWSAFWPSHPIPRGKTRFYPDGGQIWRQPTNRKGINLIEMA